MAKGVTVNENIMDAFFHSLSLSLRKKPNYLGLGSLEAQTGRSEEIIYSMLSVSGGPQSARNP